MSVLETCTPRDKLPCPCISVNIPRPASRTEAVSIWPEDKTFPYVSATRNAVRYSFIYISQTRLPLREARWFNDESYLRAGPGFNVGLR